MDLGPLRRLALTVNFSAHGVDAVVTRPAPDNAPIDARLIWLTPESPDQPAGSILHRREARRVAALQRDQVATIPIGTMIVAPPRAGDDDAAWRVDGIERVEADHVRVVVIRTELTS